KPDPNYSYFDTGIRLDNGSGSQWTGYVLNMTSQGWLTEADSNRPVVRAAACSADFAVRCLLAHRLDICPFISCAIFLRFRLSFTFKIPLQWWHWLVVIVPNKIRHTDAGMVYLTGGGNDG